MAAEVEVTGRLPEGGKDTVTIRLASVVPFLVMKGVALVDRLKEKDAYDICYSVAHYPGGLDALVDELQAHIDHGLVREGLN
jgi:predicted nucleotidyltransferase